MQRRPGGVFSVDAGDVVVHCIPEWHYSAEGGLSSGSPREPFDLKLFINPYFLYYFARLSRLRLGARTVWRNLKV